MNSGQGHDTSAISNLCVKYEPLCVSITKTNTDEPTDRQMGNIYPKILCDTCINISNIFTSYFDKLPLIHDHNPLSSNNEL